MSYNLFEDIKKNLLEDEEATITNVSFELNTDVLPVLDTGTYGREDYIWSSYDMDEVPEEEQPTYDDLDKLIVQYGIPVVTDYIKKVFPSARVSGGKVWHPKYYNYDTDQLDFTVSVSPEEFKEVVERTVEDTAFKDFLKDKYSSRSGFISSMADNLDEFYQEDLWRRFCQVVMFNLRDEDFKSTTEKFWEDVKTNF